VAQILYLVLTHWAAQSLSPQKMASPMRDIALRFTAVHMSVSFQPLKVVQIMEPGAISLLPVILMKKVGVMLQNPMHSIYLARSVGEEVTAR